MEKRKVALILTFLYLFYVLLSFFGDGIREGAAILICFANAGTIIYYARYRAFRNNWLILGSIPLLWGLNGIIWLYARNLPATEPSNELFFLYLYFIPNLVLTITIVGYFLKTIHHLHRTKLIMDITIVLIIFFGVTGHHFVRLFEQNNNSLGHVLVNILYLVSGVISFLVTTIWILSSKLRTISIQIRLVVTGFTTFLLSNALQLSNMIQDNEIPAMSEPLALMTFLFFSYAILSAPNIKNDLRFRGESNIEPRPENLMNTRIILWTGIIPIILWLTGNLYLLNLVFITFAMVVYQFFALYIQRTYMTEAMVQEKVQMAENLEALVHERTLQLEASNKALFIQSTTDSLTGLSNRDHFLLMVEARIQEMKPFTLMYLDIDRFKTINDVHGHDMGDQILKMVAHRLKTSNIENCVFTRIGGDEFGIIFDSINNEEIAATCEAIISRLTAPFDQKDFRFFLNVSLGATKYPEDTARGDRLLQFADIAMEQARRSNGPSKYKLYSTAYLEGIHRRNQIEMALRNADFKQDFLLYYQPKFSSASKELIGMEALIRWPQADGTFISPAEFIPIAEDHGMIMDLSRWIFRTAVAQIVQWNETYDRALIMSMNVSPVSFDNPNFISNFELLMDVCHAMPEWIELEITEHSAMQIGIKMIDLFETLSTIGIHVAIDDFGTGYSSLSYIKKFEVDTIKIAKELIDNITTDNNDFLIVKAIIMMAKGMGLSTIAEGVERENQLDLLRDLDCDAIQGYIYGRPVPAHEFEKKYLGK